jgi:hypothetical protein
VNNLDVSGAPGQENINLIEIISNISYISIHFTACVALRAVAAPGRQKLELGRVATYTWNPRKRRLRCGYVLPWRRINDYRNF